MNFKKIGVGIIRASHTSWAATAHIPAIRALPEYYELKAVSTSRAESAQLAQEEFGVPAFDNYMDLIHAPGVDLVVVAVKVPYHYELVNAAIDAGKMIFCEWPLGNGLDEAIELANRAKLANIRTAVGLQARFQPVIRYARDLIADGYIGEVLGTTLVGSGMSWGNTTNKNIAYIFDSSNGVTMLSIPILHAYDALSYMLGKFKNVSSQLEILYSEIHVEDEIITNTSADQVSISGTLASGAVVSTYYNGGVSRGEKLRWAIHGSKGDLIITGGEMGHVQTADLKLEGGREDEKSVQELAVPSSYFDLAPNLPTGVGRSTGFIYAQFAKDIYENTHLVPDFEHAATHHKLLDAIETASRTGIRQNIE